MKPVINFTPEQLKQKSLEIITKSNGGVHEDKILEAIFPPPVYPGNDASEAAKDEWRTSRGEWVTMAYGGEGVEYRDTYAFACSSATIALTKEGKINEHNNGYASYSFTLKGAR